MNRLSEEKRIKILKLLVEGVSMRSITRIEDVNYRTVQSLLLAAGKACRKFHDKNVRAITGVRKIHCDELWQYVYHKQRSIEWADPWDIGGDVWTFTAIDADSKLLVSYFVRKYRNTPSAVRLFEDIKERHVKTPLLFTDGLPAYREACDVVFPRKENLTQTRHYEESDHSTAFVERHNLTIRESNRRYSRKTLGFSKRYEHHRAMLDLFAVWYNFVRDHQTLQVPPACEAGLTTEILGMDFIEQLTADNERKPKRPGPRVGTKYRKRQSKRE